MKERGLEKEKAVLDLLESLSSDERDRIVATLIDKQAVETNSFENKLGLSEIMSAVVQEQSDSQISENEQALAINMIENNIPVYGTIDGQEIYCSLDDVNGSQQENKT